MNTAAALPAGAAWDDDTAPEAGAGPRAASPPVASGVVSAARKAMWFAFASLGGLLLGLAVLAYLM